MTAKEKAAQLLHLFEQHGQADYIGEPVSQLAHALQCAQLAQQAGADDELVLAALLHDVGHLADMANPELKGIHMDGYGLVDHEQWGAQLLRGLGCSERLACLVASHVQAKRYLVYSQPAYRAALSDASRQTLLHQGGPMTEAEAEAFESDPWFADYIQLRKWDEQAKAVDIAMPALRSFEPMLIHHFEKHAPCMP